MAPGLIQQLFELQGASIDPVRADDLARKLAAELAVASRLFASVPFEAEPAAYA